jgi:hypothetical protein
VRRGLVVVEGIAQHHGALGHGLGQLLVGGHRGPQSRQGLLEARLGLEVFAREPLQRLKLRRLIALGQDDVQSH